MQLSAFHPFVAPEVIGCPAPLMDQALLMVATEFCQETLIWSELSDPMPLVDSVATYDLTAPTGAQALTVTDVWCGTRKLQPVLRADAYLSGASIEPVSYSLTEDLSQIQVYPMPTSPTLALVVQTAFIPDLAATELPDLMKRFVLTLSSGVKARLMTMPNVPWSNPPLGGYYRQIFDNGVLDARANAMHDGVPGVLTVAPRRFGF